MHSNFLKSRTEVRKKEGETEYLVVGLTLNIILYITENTSEKSKVNGVFPTFCKWNVYKTHRLFLHIPFKIRNLLKI